MILYIESLSLWLQSKKAEDDLEDKVRDLKSKSSEQETQLEEYKRRVTQLEREKDQLEGVCSCVYLWTLGSSSWCLLYSPSEDLDAAEQRCEGAKKELESTLSELSDI